MRNARFIPRGRLLAAGLVATVLFFGSAVVAVIIIGGDEPRAAGAGNGGAPGASEASATATGVDSTPTSMATATVATPEPKPDPALLDPARLLREGRYDDAAAGYRGVLAATKAPALRAEAFLGLGRALIEDEDHEGGLQALRDGLASAPAGSDVAARVAYVLGRTLNDDGRATGAEAVKVLAAPAEAGTGVLAPYLRYELGRAKAAMGDDSGAQQAWEAVFASNAPDVLRASAMRGEAGLAVKPATKATLLARALEANEDARTLADLAGARRAAGDGGWVESATRLIGRYPSSAEALRMLTELTGAAVAVDPGLAGLVYYRHGDLANARAVLEPAASAEGVGDAERAFRLYYLGATLEDLGANAAAIAAYDAAAALPDSGFRHKARYWAARTMERTDGRAASVRYAALVREGPAGEFTAESAFRAGYALYSAGDQAGAFGGWEALAPAGDARILYWLGRAKQASGDLAGGRASLESAAAADPLGFYGIEAARALGRGQAIDTRYVALRADAAPDWPGLEAWLTSVAGAAPGAPARTAAKELAFAGLEREAESVLFAAAANGSAWTTYYVIRDAWDAGMTGTAARLAVRLQSSLRVSWQDAPKGLLQAAYPVDYVSTLDSEARKNGIDPLFLAALIRQESFWDAWVGSGAGALGLAQVIPPTGEAIAASLGVEKFEARDLFRPAVAIRFGANYVAGQLRRFGEAQVALAAYNAGPGNAARWAAVAAGKPAAEFVEAVDFSETRGYVESILEHYVRYQAAWREEGMR